jgi:hypothetical protein
VQEPPEKREPLVQTVWLPDPLATQDLLAHLVTQVLPDLTAKQDQLATQDLPAHLVTQVLLAPKAKQEQLDP